MVSESTISNITLTGHGNTVTIYTTRVVENGTKKVILLPTTESDKYYGQAPKDQKIVDLKQVELRYTVDGHIDSTDETNFRKMCTWGGIVTMVYNSVSLSVNVEKYSVTKSASKMNDELDITFTCIKGTN